tara:strand:- start:2216 stop:2404 length:189 start_codon:yes stop_codon:yes gene_type:complete
MKLILNPLLNAPSTSFGFLEFSLVIKRLRLTLRPNHPRISYLNDATYISGIMKTEKNLARHL